MAMILVEVMGVVVVVGSNGKWWWMIVGVCGDVGSGSIRGMWWCLRWLQRVEIVVQHGCGGGGCNSGEVVMMASRDTEHGGSK